MSKKAVKEVVVPVVDGTQPERATRFAWIRLRGNDGFTSELDLRRLDPFPEVLSGRLLQLSEYIVSIWPASECTCSCGCDALVEGRSAIWSLRMWPGPQRDSTLMPSMALITVFCVGHRSRLLRGLDPRLVDLHREVGAVGLPVRVGLVLVLVLLHELRLQRARRFGWSK